MPLLLQQKQNADTYNDMSLSEVTKKLAPSPHLTGNTEPRECAGSATAASRNPLAANPAKFGQVYIYLVPVHDAVVALLVFVVDNVPVRTRFVPPPPLL
eukprot:COSAG01_NODE_7828_length_3038_cov_1.237155_1_plen_98_part_10